MFNVVKATVFVQQRAPKGPAQIASPLLLCDHEELHSVFDRTAIFPFEGFDCRTCYR